MRVLSSMLVMLLAAACGSTTDSPPPPQWNATLTGTAGFPSVGGTAVATTGVATTTVTATITGATPGAVHPWHIHFGTCADDQGIVGDAAAYPHLQVAAGGGATANATVNVALAAGQPYFINVHASPQDLPTIVACGNLVLQ